MAELNPETDIALTALCLHARPGQTLTQREIAQVCGCTRANIYLIEKRALQKLRQLAPNHAIADYRATNTHDNGG